MDLLANWQLALGKMLERVEDQWPLAGICTLVNILIWMYMLHPYRL